MTPLYVRAPGSRAHHRPRPGGQVARPGLSRTFAGFRGGGDFEQSQVVGAHTRGTMSDPVSGADWRSDRESTVASLDWESPLLLPAAARLTYFPILAPRRNYTCLSHRCTPVLSKSCTAAWRVRRKMVPPISLQISQNDTNSAKLAPNMPSWKIKSLHVRKLGL